VPFAIALGVLSFGTAMLQIGTWLVWIPVAIWLSYQGETGWAIFTAVLLIGRGAGVATELRQCRLCTEECKLSAAVTPPTKPTKAAVQQGPKEQPQLQRTPQPDKPSCTGNLSPMRLSLGTRRQNLVFRDGREGS
jgi:hypothetical protein